MTTFPNTPKVLKEDIVLIDAESARVQRIVALQHNPDTLRVQVLLDRLVSKNARPH